MQKFVKENKLLIVAIILLCVFFSMKSYETFVGISKYAKINQKETKEPKSSCNMLHKSHANSCYNCEEQLAGTKRSYQSQKTKCFSCEEDLKQKMGDKFAFFGQPSKCFDCEAQLKGN